MPLQEQEKQAILHNANVVIASCIKASETLAKTNKPEEIRKLHTELLAIIGLSLGTLVMLQALNAEVSSIVVVQGPILQPN